MPAEASSLVVLQVFLFAGKRFATVRSGRELRRRRTQPKRDVRSGAAQRAASNRPLPGAVAALFL
jgi:hypothetical protein